jgi:two-component system chemotaxis response regulator CheY
MKILVVDDEFVSRRKLQKIMSLFGDVEVATSGIEAIQAYALAFEEGSPYDIITMDIMMPDLNGIEALKEIRQMEDERNIPLGKGAKIVMVTVKSTPGDVLGSFREGCEAYVVKPFDRTKIEDALRRLDAID